MPRQARTDAPGEVHHVIARGIERRKIFRDDENRYKSFSRLGSLVSETQTRCFAWALIPNHFHFSKKLNYNSRIDSKDPIGTLSVDISE